jgi:hypothetical protein
VQGGNKDRALINVDEVMTAGGHETCLHNAIPAPDMKADTPAPCPMGVDEFANGKIDPAFFKGGGYEIALPSLVRNLLPMLQLAAAAFHVVFAEWRDAFG